LKRSQAIPPIWRDYKIIDAHVHIGDYFDINARFSADDLFAHMRKYNISVAALSAVTKNIRGDNDLVAGAIRRHPAKIVGLAHIDPTAGDALDEIERALGMGFKGLKLHPHYDAYNVFDSRVTFKVLENAASHRLPVLIHTGTPPMTTPMHVGYLAQHFPDVNFIAAHMGLVDSSLEAVEAGRMADNIYMDMTAASVTAVIEDAILRLGEDRFVWGTDAPYLNFVAEFFKLLSLRVSDEARRKILWDNPKRIYRL
jgi:uncharacterized protein